MQLVGVGELLLESMRLFREVFEGKIRGQDGRTSDEHLVSTSQSIPYAKVKRGGFRRIGYSVCAPVT